LPGRFVVLTPFQPRIAISRRIEDAGARAALHDILAAIRDEDADGERWGFIARTAAEGADADALRADAEGLRRRWEEIADALGNVHPPARLHGEGRGLTGVLRDRARAGLRRIVVD